MRQKFGRNSVKKNFYFSDGAGSQYKNRYNFINLLHHKQDFKVEAEWHFFATAHGKSACDGIGGCVKRNAYRASLQAKESDQITTTKKLFEWASNYFKKIHFAFCTIKEHEEHESLLQLRFNKTKTITQTRQYHSFLPINKNDICCKIFSQEISGTVKKSLCKRKVIKINIQDSFVWIKLHVFFTLEARNKLSDYTLKTFN